MIRAGTGRLSRRAGAELTDERLSPVQRVAFVALITLVAGCAVGGGSAFADTTSLLYLRPLAVLCLAVTLLLPGRIATRGARAPLLLLGALALITAVQLVPLPPAIWTVLPGRAAYVPAASIAGVAQPWRPLSLTPDATWNSLVALIIPAAALVGAARLAPPPLVRLVPWLIGLCVASAMIGVVQFAGGPDSPLYQYQRMHLGLPDGFLANRNHQALLLSLAFPALRVLVELPSSNDLRARRRLWLALGIGLLLIPVLLATGSRAGLVLGLTAMGLALLGFPRVGRHFAQIGTPLRMSLIALFIVAAAVSFFAGRAVSINRLAGSEEVLSDQRFKFAPVVNGIIKESFPAGTGQGSFDPVYRQHEPDANLDERYANHAHNDYQEVLMTMGLPGALLLLGFAAWVVRRAARVFRWTSSRGLLDAPMLLGRLGAIVIALVAMASVVDYPLRTPLVAALFAIACLWLGRAGVSSGDLDAQV